MEDLIEFGRLFFVKNSYVEIKKLHTNKKELIKYFSQFNQSIVSDITGLEENCENTYLSSNKHPFLSLYKDFLSDGYSIIRVANRFHYDNDKKQISFAEKNCYSLLPITMSSENSCQVIKTSQEILKNDNIANQYMYNLFEDGEAIDFDYFDPYQTNKNFSMLERLDLLLREKTNNLNYYEQQMFKEYRTYNLEKILTYDYSNQIINHDNAGTIVITPNTTHEKTVKKLQHGSEIVWSLVKEGLIDFNCNSTIGELSEYTNSILIQLCKNEAILWLNPIEKRTQYQQQELIRIIDSLQALKEKGYNLEISASICDNLSSYEIEYGEILNTDSIKKGT